MKLLAALLLVSTVSYAEVKIPIPETENLPNGLKIVWFLDQSLPVVDVALMFQSGNRDDLQGKSGTSELLASVLDRGAGGIPASELARQIEALGASRVVSAGEESFSVALHGLAPDASVLLDMLARISLRPDFLPEEVAREHARILDRWNHLGDYAESLAGVAFGRLLTAGTVYGRGSFLSEAEFKKVGRKDLLDYHSKHFVPSNAVLMVVGRVNREQFRAQIIEKFGAWKNAKITRTIRSYSDGRLSGVKPGEVLVIDRPKFTQAQVRLGSKGPLLQSPDRYENAVANALLGEYFNSRLNSVLRDQMGLTYGIGSSFSYSKEAGHFSITSSTRNEAVGTLLKKSLEVVRTLRAGPLGEEETGQAKEYLAGGFPLTVSTINAIASRWLGGYLFGLPSDDLNRFVPGIQKVTAEGVLKAVRKHIDPDRFFIVVAGDGEPIIKSLKEAGLTRYRRITAKDLK